METVLPTSAAAAPPFAMLRQKCKPLPPIPLLALVFLAWKAEWATGEYGRLKDENKRLAQSLGRQATSIWHMRKADLVDAAVKELKMSRAVAEEHRVGELQLLLKEARAAAEAAVSPDNPLESVPAGISRMKLAELQQQAEARSIAPGKMGREEIIRAIKAHHGALPGAKAQAAALQTATSQKTKPPSTNRASRSLSVKRALHHEIGTPRGMDPSGFMVVDPPEMALVPPLSSCPPLAGSGAGPASSGGGGGRPAEATLLNIDNLSTQIWEAMEKHGEAAVAEQLSHRLSNGTDSAALQTAAMAVANTKRTTFRSTVT